MKTMDLERKAKLLKESTYFVNHTELAPLIEKQSIFLVLAGRKPVSQATSSKWIKTDHGAHAEPDDINELRKFLNSLGLTYHVSVDQYAANVFVSLDPNKLDSYLAAEKAEDAAAVGKLFGYPKTAVDAFVQDACMELDEQDGLMEAAGISTVMPSFRLSNRRVQEELAILEDWYQTLKEYDLV